ncbi:transporter substrate-binding domain-containing protein [Castellaniella hirudinis]|uniref:transporter substrate-binding domain-containing protein n=1 Tax=Castellaniella hirudinis TaxID=1144617 RepID=UPI0039C3E52F
MNRLLKKAALIATAFCVSSTALAADVIRLGVDPTFPPYESIDAKGDMQGVDIDLGNAICAEMKVECKWVRINFDGAIPALNARKIDAILSALTITKERAKQVLFSTTLYNSPSRMMVDKSQDLDTTLEAVKGKTIGVAQGTSQAAYANKHWKGKGVNLVMYQNEEKSQQDLVLGRVDALLSDSAASLFFLETPQGSKFHMSGSSVVDPEVFGNGVAMGLRLNDTELQTRIDTAINTLKKTGEYQKIIEKYKQYGLEPV